MAETVGELYARIGLDYDELNQQFVQVDRTLRDNMTRLNRQQNIIDLQARIDLTGLDEAADATRIFEIRQRALQQRIELQRQRMQLYENVLADAKNRTGELSDETQRAQVDFERARLQVARLEQQLEDLGNTQNQTNSIFGNFKDTIKEQFQVIASREFLAEVPSKIQEISTAVVGLIEDFKELETQAYELNMPFDRTKQFLRELRLAGGDIGDFEGYIRGITDAFVKGEVDDPEFIALDKYGAKITDATGRLKDFKAITEEVYQAYLKAKAAGEEIEFLQLTGGESGIRDAIQFFERYGEAKKDALKIVDSGLDVKEMHEAERALNLLTEQTGEFGDALKSLMVESHTKALRGLFAVFREGTKVISQNSDVIKNVFAKSLDATLNISPIGKPFALLAEGLAKIGEEAENSTNSVAELIRMASRRIKLDTKLGDGNTLSQYGIQRVNQFKDEIEQLNLELNYTDEIQRRIAETNLWRQHELEDKLYVSPDERAAIEELYGLKIEQIRRDHAANLAEIAKEQEEKIQQIQEESAERTKQLMKETADIQFNATHSAYEKEIRDIHNWEREAIESINNYMAKVQDKSQLVEEAMQTATAAMAKETEAYQREMDRIKNANQSLAEKIFEQEHSRRDIDIMKAQKERAQLYDEGLYSSQQIEKYFKNRLKEIGKTVATDTTGEYSRAPKLNDRYLDKLPNTDFYGNLQAQVEKAMTQADHPAQKIEELYRQNVESFNKYTQDLNQYLGTFNKDFSATMKETLDRATQNFSEISQRIADSSQVQIPAATENQPNLQAQIQAATPDIDISTVNAELAEISQKLGEVSQRAGEIAQSASKPPNINISPNNNVNIDLGGAYVFDESMKAQLVDEITREVTDAITSAVQKATTQANYSYGN